MSASTWPPQGRPAGHADDAAVSLAVLLRRLRTEAGLTQEELAGAAGVSRRAVSDLERGVANSPQKETVRLLADALRLIGPARAQFEALARGRPLTNEYEAAPVPAMRSLPRDVASFTGRERELDQLTQIAAGAGGVVGVHAIGGMAGVGKTAFAVHGAHRVAPMFPDGQIFLPLHGHTPGHRPVDPADALAALLLTIGVQAAQVPPGPQARAALWRDRVADSRILLVLDDAASSEQVRPLLPGGSGSLVLVTSRRHLSALDDAIAITLDPLPSREATALLVRVAGRTGLSPADPAVADIVRLCGNLPLAIGMVARQLHHHPAWTAAQRAGVLASARDRLELLVTEDLSVAAAFDLSYAGLTEDQQLLFRRLGLHPGADIDEYAAAALSGSDLSAGRRGLEALYDQHLLTEPAPGRYRMHDLIREHARALADRFDPAEDSNAATDCLLDYYQWTAARADILVTRQTRPGRAMAQGTGSVATVAFADREQALAWARAERASILACLDHAAAAGQHARVIALTAGLSGLLWHDGPWSDALTRHAAAAEAARSVGDRLAHANALNDLGGVRRMTADDYPAAAEAFEQALAIYRDIGDRLGEANALTNLGLAERLTAGYQVAVERHEEALAIYREVGDRRDQANAMCGLGLAWISASDYVAAAQALRPALAIYRDAGDRHGEGNALTNLGMAQLGTDEYPAAAEAFEEALGIFRDMGNRVGQANTVRGLGVARMWSGDYPGAARAFEEALAICRDTGGLAGQGDALVCLGAVRRMSGDYAAAAHALEQALGIYYDTGYRGGEAEALNERGALYRVSGDLAQARDCHQRALSWARSVPTPLVEANALAGLGRCDLADGLTIEAETLLRQALGIYERTGEREGKIVAAELDALASQARSLPGGQ